MLTNRHKKGYTIHDKEVHKDSIDRCLDCGGVRDQPDDEYYDAICKRCTWLFLGIPIETVEEKAIFDALPNKKEMEVMYYRYGASSNSLTLKP